MCRGVFRGVFVAHAENKCADAQIVERWVTTLPPECHYDWSTVAYESMARAMYL